MYICLVQDFDSKGVFKTINFDIITIALRFFKMI